MNKEIFEGKWKQLKGEAKKQWSKLTDDDLRRAEGGYDKLVGVLQERYGYAREEAHKKLDHWMDRHPLAAK